MNYQVVFQWRIVDQDPLDFIVDMEETIEAALSNHHVVDGHDFGCGEGNVFVHTDNPERCMAEMASHLVNDVRFANVKVGYRKFTDEEYSPLWPPDLQNIVVA
jgi:hypothetical protein